MKKILMLAAFSLTLSSCQTTNQTIGTTLGVVGGGILGSQLGGGSGKAWFAVSGALIGGLIGNQIGSYLDEQDKQKLAMTTQKTFETGKVQSFSNPETGVSATTKIVKTPQKTETKIAKLEKVEQCNTVQQQVTLKDGSKKTENITACKGPNGWYQV